MRGFTSFSSWIRQLKCASPRSAPAQIKQGRARASQAARLARLRFRPQFEVLEDRTLLAVTILNGGGLGYAGNTDNVDPPDTCGAAGPSSYIEITNGQVSIYTPKSTGATVVRHDISDFFFNPAIGNRQQVDAGSCGVCDSTGLFDNLMADGRFIIGDIDVDPNTNVSNFNFAVSTSNNPATLTAADWKFYTVSTTEGPVGSTTWTDYPGNPGFNADALVITFNMASGGFLTGNAQVVSVSASDLANGVSNPAVFHNDITGSFSYRPATMHDSVSGDPMWLIHNPDTGTSVDVVRMDNVLSDHAASFTTTSLTLPPALDFSALSINPTNPDGSTISDIDDRILKASEYNHTLVATQKVQVSGNELDTQWYAIDVTGTPTFQLVGGAPNVGRVGFGANTYAFDPGIEINSLGQIGLTFNESDRVGGAANPATGGFVSTFVTGRTPGDPAGTMQPSVLVPAGTGFGNIADRSGDFSGMNVDPVDGTFWAVNEVGNNANGATAIANFSLTPPAGGFVIGQNPSGTVTTPVSFIDFTFSEPMNPGSFSVAADVDSFTGPGNTNLLSQITGFSWLNGNKTLHVTFNTQSVLGAYTMVIGPQILRASDNAAMDQDHDGTPGEAIQDRYSGSFNLVGVFFAADFSDAGGNPNLDGFTIDNTGGAVAGLWHLSTGRGNQAGHSADDSMYFGQGEGANGGGNYNVGDTAGRITSPVIDLTHATVAQLSFNYFLQTEGFPGFDVASVQISVDGGSFANLASNGGSGLADPTSGWTHFTADLSAYLGHTIQVRFDFNTVDDINNGFEGWYVDDVMVTGIAPLVITGTAGDDIISTHVTGPQLFVTVNGSTTAYNLNTVTSLTINAGAGNDQVNIDSTAPTEPVTVNGEDNNDTIRIASGADLGNIKSPVIINGGNGSDTLAGPDTPAGGITWNITGAGSGTVGSAAFANIENLAGGAAYDLFKFFNGGGIAGTINGGPGTNALVYTSYTGGPITANAQTGAASLINGGAAGGFTNIGALYGSPSTADTLTGPDTPAAGVSWNITAANTGKIGAVFSFIGVENLIGGTGYDLFKFFNGGSVSGTVNGGANTNALVYTSYTGGPITVNLQTAAATLVKGGAAAGFSNIGALYGSASAADTLVGANAASTWNITSANAGKIGAVFSFSGTEKLTGGSADDVFKFFIGGSVSGAVNGAGGTNTLDYSLLDAAHPVTVNLTAGTATGTGGVSNVRNVTGGAGNDNITGNLLSNVLLGNGGNDTLNGGGGGSDHDVLVGGTGNDTLSTAGSSRSILIGGAGTDQLSGGTAGDILIGGNTDYDANTAALQAILAEWIRTDAGEDYATRISHIRNGGGVNGSFKFNATTVHDDGSADTLTGAVNAADLDWFWANLPQDSITDQEAGEQVN